MIRSEIDPAALAVLAAARDCAHRGPVIDRPNPTCGCGGTVLCARDTRVVHPEDCVRCQAVRFGLA